MSVKQLVEEALGATDKTKKSQFTAYFPDLIDVISNNHEVKFLLTDGELRTERDFDGILFQPPPPDSLGFSLPEYKAIEEFSLRHSGVTGVSGVSGGAGVCLEDNKLFKKLLQYHKDSAELPDERLYLLIVAWDFHTHLLEKFEYSPIIFFSLIYFHGL